MTNTLKESILGKVMSFQRGYDLTNSQLSYGDVPVVGSSEIIGYHNEIKKTAPVLLIGRSGTVGRPQFYTQNIWPHNTTLFVTDFHGNVPKYCYYFLKALNLEDFANSSGVPTLNRNFIHPLKIKIHEVHQQTIISKILSSLDDKIELNNKINAELNQIAKSLYDYWFVQFDFPDKNGLPYKSSGGKIVWNEELKRKIPEGWEVGGFDKIGDIVGGSTPSKTNKNHFTKTGIPWITPKDLSLNTGKKFISRGELDVTQLGIKNASLKIMPKGTVLLSSRAPIGYIAISRDDVTTNQGFKSLVPKNPYTTEFAYYTVQLYIDAMIQYASGSTFSEISGSTLKMIKIVIPDGDIVKKFTEKVTSIFALQDILERENDQLSKLRDWILPMLMNGQVTVAD